MSNSINTLFGYTLADSKARTEVAKKLNKPTVEGTEGQVLQVVNNTDTSALEIKWADTGIGNLSGLKTTKKDSVVNSINELFDGKVDDPTNANTADQVLMVYDDNGTKKAKYMDLTFATTSEVEALFD